MRVALLLFALFSIPTAPPAGADYVLSITGPSVVTPGQAFPLSAVLTSDANDRHDSMVFDVRFTGPVDLVYRGYLLDPVAYRTGGADDSSVPGYSYYYDHQYWVPSTICAAQPCQSDYSQIHIEAVTRVRQTFGTGTLVTMDLFVPPGTPLGEPYTVEIIPDTFALGLEVVETVSGGPFQFFVVPEPGTLALLVLAVFSTIRRRSKNSAHLVLGSRY